MSSTPDSNKKLREYFCGIAVIIDDKVNNEQDPDYCSNKIFKALQDANMPVVSYEKLPEKEAYPSIAKASMIILDWQLSDGFKGATELQEDDKVDKLDFLEEIIKGSTAPVFIISNKINQAEKDIKARRDEEGNSYLEKEIKNRIFLIKKTDFSKGPEGLFDQFFNFLSKWLEKEHALYALKEWELVADKARSDMYRDFSQSSWADIMWNRIKQDISGGKGKIKQNKLLSVREEFGEFITRNIINRFGEFEFIDSRFTPGVESDEKLGKILSAEQFISTKSPNGDSDQSLRTGNLYCQKQESKDNKKQDSKANNEDDIEYFLVITADCDLVRANKKREVFCLKGKSIDKEIIAPDKVSIDSIPTGNENVSPTPTTEEQLKIATEKLEYLIKMWDQPRQSYGVIHSESQKKYYLSAVDDKIIQFDLSIEVKTQDSLKVMNLKGRVVSPYIGQIQQAAAKWMIRQGNLPFPEEYFQA